MATSSNPQRLWQRISKASGSKSVVRVVSVIAATVIALACGTNYAYSAWAPQFASRLKLSSTEINIIGTAANLGMYGTGIPVGMLVDHKGPRPAVLFGSLCLGAGYYPIHRAYVDGMRSFGIVPLCIFSLLTGIGSCSAFFAAVKTSAWNWPDHRGTATAFPMAGFGLSAFFFSGLSSLAFPDDTSGFLLFLAIGTFGMVFASAFFLRVVHHSADYAPLPTHEDPLPSLSSNRRTPEPAKGRTHKSGDGTERGRASAELRRDFQPQDSSGTRVRSATRGRSESPVANHSHNAAVARPELIYASALDDHGADDRNYGQPTHLDIRGLALVRRPEFWRQFTLLGLLTGIGLMTINNIGNDAQALWSRFDGSVSKDFIEKRQYLHVAIISLTSFSGRLASGVGSDVIQKRLGMSRYWFVALASVVFSLAQLSAIGTADPHYLWVVSGLTGLAYGITFGVYPALVTETFGLHGFSQNWGCMCLAAIIASNIFNLIYGKVFDHNSVILPDGHRDCPDGAKCYGTAYVVTFAASLVTLGISIWGILFDRRSAAAAAAAAVAAVTAARDQLVRNHSQTSVSPDENTDGSKKTRRKPSRSPTRSSNEAARVDGPAQLI